MFISVYILCSCISGSVLTKLPRNVLLNYRVSTVREKVREKHNFSRSGNCQGILKLVRERGTFICAHAWIFFKLCIFRVPTRQGKVREIWFFFKVREKSGNSVKWSGKLENLQKSGKSQGI